MSCHLLQCRFGKRIIYQKYIVSVMCCFALLVLHGSRYTLTRTITSMMDHQTAPVEEDEDACNGKRQTRSEDMEYLDWPAEKKSYVFSAFYVGYIFQVPFGVLPDLYGAKHFMSCGVIGSALITASVPFILTKIPWFAMAGVQVVLGLIQALSQVSLMSLMSHYVPKRQVAVLIAIAFTGPNLGTMMANYFIRLPRTWTMPFYIWTAASLVWLVCFMMLVYSTPSNHPFICESEKAFLEADLGVHLPSTIPLREILVDPGVWALVTVQFGNNLLIFLCANFLPRIIKKVLHLDASIELYIVAIPVVFEFAASIGSGYVSDYLIVNHYLPVSYTRTLYVTCGILTQNIFMLLATYANCTPVLFLVCLTVAMVARGVAFPAIKANIIDRTRHYVGTIQGIQNGLASTTGLVIPHLINYMCSHNKIAEWRKTFWLTLVVCLFTTTVYFVWTEGERANWDKVKPRKEKIVLG